VAVVLLRAQGHADEPFKWTYHFFWGLEDLIGVYSEIWPGVPTNKKMGVLWPNDPDGLAFAVWVPQGMWGWIAQRFDAPLFPLRRHYAAPIRQDEAVESPAA
jgi:hypothetical protein